MSLKHCGISTDRNVFSKNRHSLKGSWRRWCSMPIDRRRTSCECKRCWKGALGAPHHLPASWPVTWGVCTLSEPGPGEWQAARPLPDAARSIASHSSGQLVTAHRSCDCGRCGHAGDTSAFQRYAAPQVDTRAASRCRARLLLVACPRPPASLPAPWINVAHEPWAGPAREAGQRPGLHRARRNDRQPLTALQRHRPTGRRRNRF